MSKVVDDQIQQFEAARLVLRTLQLAILDADLREAQEALPVGNSMMDEHLKIQELRNTRAIANLLVGQRFNQVGQNQQICRCGLTGLQQPNIGIQPTNNAGLVRGQQRGAE